MVSALRDYNVNAIPFSCLATCNILVDKKLSPKNDFFSSRFIMLLKLLMQIKTDLWIFPDHVLMFSFILIPGCRFLRI